MLKGTKQDAIDKATRIFGAEVAREHWPRKGDDGVAEAALIAAWFRQFR